MNSCRSQPERMSNTGLTVAAKSSVAPRWLIQVRASDPMLMAASFAPTCCHFSGLCPALRGLLLHAVHERRLGESRRLEDGRRHVDDMVECHHLTVGGDAS